MIMIGLTGGRHVGKSSLASHVVERHGFARMHPFDGGKVASEAWFRHLGADAGTAHDMVHGKLKDRPSPLLPVGPDGQHAMPRLFYEKFGAFLGRTLGPDWTLGTEIRRLAVLGHDRIISESIVFEAEAFRAMGGKIIRIDRPGAGVIGIETDPVVRTIAPDFVFENSCSDVTRAREAFEEFLFEAGLIPESPDADPDPLSDFDLSLS